MSSHEYRKICVVTAFLGVLIGLSSWVDGQFDPPA